MYSTKFLSYFQAWQVRLDIFREKFKAQTGLYFRSPIFLIVSINKYHTRKNRTRGYVIWHGKVL
eukprot:Gb_41701 [translate_table: standard]